MEDPNANCIFRIGKLGAFRIDGENLEPTKPIGWPLQPKRIDIDIGVSKREVIVYVRQKKKEPWSLSPHPQDRSGTWRNDVRMRIYFLSNV